MLEDFVSYFNEQEYMYRPTTGVNPMDGIDVSSANDFIYNVQKSFYDGFLKKPDPRKYIGASSMHLPTIFLGLRMLDYPRVSKKTSLEVIYKKVRFMAGDFFESIICYLMKDYGIPFRTQLEIDLSSMFPNSNLPFKGHIDVLLDDGTLLDIKSLSNSAATKFIKEGVSNYFGYRSQMAFYLFGLKTMGINARAGWLIYNKDTAKLDLVRADHEELQREWDYLLNKMDFLEKIKTVNDLIKTNLPEPKKEIKGGTPTGRLLLPRSMRECNYANCFYNIYKVPEESKTKIYVHKEMPGPEVMKVKLEKTYQDLISSECLF